MIEQFTQELINWINALPPASIYGVFLLVAYVENILPPIPGDLLVAFGGYLAAEQIIDIVPVLVLTTVASVFGFMTMYGLGARWGTLIKEKQDEFWLFRFIHIEYMEKVRDWMQRWGQGVILANRFLAGTRSVISLTAGISHTPVSSTIISSTVSSLLWNFLLLMLGWIIHENWRVIGDYLSVYSWIILSGIALIVLIKLGLNYLRKQRKSSRT
ncbi:MAG: DedA family protein [Balneolaceae bacterium]|nr:DedA family protein [Balneolaceae bacterium]